ncbi:glycosyltransferase [Acetivibrio clariflavus]|uniref:Glycosyltransferase n=1 Tax=Acetivibrio clariflavus (strain DSM 19732 / NBRC 101661 / EBR45) TaxID=720554 RepID=G8LSM5_ACECE|nr:glycosyltransferase [Acetivibrio clariflavus]AEV69377.1 glycosyltransferase [Acetivibrio clariflavus DSM 19732]
MEKRQKLLYVVEAMGGGVFTYIVDLANELADSYDIYIAYAIRQQTPHDYKTYFDKRIHLIEVRNFGRSINPIKDVKAFFEIRKIADKIKPDIIHMHSSKAGALGRWAFNGRKVRLFYTPHGYSFLMQNHSSIKRALYKMVESISAKRRCTTISCSEGEHQESLKLTKNAVYVNNGINIKVLQDLIDSVDKKNDQHPFTVFTLGRICHQKNPQLFNKVAELMSDVKFVWIGDGELRSFLNSKNIEITGWVDRKEALKYALMADVFILTSLWEGLPMSLLEAMYMKKLCIVSNIIGNRDVIQNGQNGYICNSVDEYVSAIRAAQAGQVDQLIEKAYFDVQNKYNTAVMAKKYSSIYQKGIPDVDEAI